MPAFPRTTIDDGKLSLPRLIAGTNWFTGCSHTSQARDRLICEIMTPRRVADVLEVFLAAGVDAVFGVRTDGPVLQAIDLAEQRTGRRCIRIATPPLNIAEGQAALDETERILDEYAAIGTDLCMPHQSTTDPLVDRRARRIVGMERYLAMIRERGMTPGLSTHLPETCVYADETGLDAATYIQIYNAAGFLMTVEVDWAHRIIHRSARPVIAIKALAAGRLHPLAGLAFVWATLRPRDMVAVGTLSADEARELVDTSLALLEGRTVEVELHYSRSKSSIYPAP